MKLSICMRAGILAAIVANATWISAVQAKTVTLPAEVQKLASIVNRSLQANPEILAAQSAIDAAQARLDGATLPLNNPELEAEIERTDVNTYQLGISQTFDWHDKRGALQQVAQAELEAARQQLAALQLAKSIELLDAVGRISIQNSINDFSRRRTEILARFTRLAKQRHAAGDIPQAELELARLSLAEASMQQARNQAELIQANSDFLSLSGQTLNEKITLPESLPINPAAEADLETIARQHPEVQAALLAAQIAKRRINAADRERKTDPTLGLSAGREDDTKLLALHFSIPLQIRNNYQSNVDTARAEALREERLAQQIYWNLRAQLQSASQRHSVIATAWKQWLNQGRTSLQQHVSLLDTLWQSGEISTTDYLLQVQQTLDTQIAGVELHGDLWSTWLDWMSASASLDAWLNNNI
ncbi:TolC family protein [Thiolapillus sp.]